MPLADSVRINMRAIGVLHNDRNAICARVSLCSLSRPHVDGISITWDGAGHILGGVEPDNKQNRLLRNTRYDTLYAANVRT